MSMWLVVLLLYPDNRFTEHRIGPYVEQAECVRAATGSMMRARPGGPQVTVFCDDGCGLDRARHLNRLFAERP